MSALPHPHPAETHDPTRHKIMDAAGEIFAEQGFQAATVREICARAGVNIAAINYYFGDKAALYVEVLRLSTCAADAQIAQAPENPNRTPEEALREMIQGMCRRMIPSERPSWAFRLMAHEMARPTPALDRVVEEVIRPSYQRLRNVLGAMLSLPPDHQTTRMCAHSVMSQIIHYFSSRPVISKVWPELQMTPEQVEMLADHISAFSICSVKELARRAH
jgi:AcrR family transcriptional regulator